jgi:hypothetical protein
MHEWAKLIPDFSTMIVLVSVNNMENDYLSIEYHYLCTVV